MRIDKPVLGQYRLLKRIGYGGMAEVYYARHLTDDSPEVALKIIRTDLAGDPIITHRFEREIRALSRLSHPHILSLLDWGEEEERVYLVLPWVADGTLDQLLEKQGGSLPIEQTIQLFGQLCAAVQYTHEQQFIHRDIKPQNVLVQQGTHALLTDFGIARDLHDTRLTLNGHGMGSVNYMAPEQALGQATSRSDLYSLGIVLYQLLTGVVPFSAETPLQILLQQARAPLPDPRQFQPTLPPGLVEILQTALAQDPEARFDSVQDLWQAVQPFQNPASVASLSGNLAAEKRAGRRPLTDARPGWTKGLEISNSLSIAPARQPSKYDLAQQATMTLDPIRQKKRFALSLKASPFHKRSHLTRQQKACLGGAAAATFLLLTGATVLGVSQPRQAVQQAASASQAAPLPSPTRTAPPHGYAFPDTRPHRVATASPHVEAA